MDHTENTILLLSLCVTAETYLLSRCLETGCVTPFIKNLLPWQRAFRDRYPATDLQATVCIDECMAGLHSYSAVMSLATVRRRPVNAIILAPSQVLPNPKSYEHFLGN
jgi:hypothetical protein